MFLAHQIHLGNLDEWLLAGGRAKWKKGERRPRQRDVRMAKHSSSVGAGKDVLQCYVTIFSSAGV